MPPLSQAYLQRIYRPIGYVFVVAVFVLLASIIYTGWAQTTITITPKLKPVTAAFDLTIGPAAPNDNIRITGTVASTNVTATVTATPETSGPQVPAHAHGTVTFHNDSTHQQPLAAGTRLQSSNGIIVRTQKRVDLAPRTTQAADVVADPLGQDGMVAAGKWTIVALWPGLQAQIYAMSDAALTGGMVQQQGGLSIDRLTAATDAASKQLEKDFGTAASGHVRLLQPVSVGTTPPADTPSDSYSVTVTMKSIDLTYPQVDVNTRAKLALSQDLADGTYLATMTVPTLAIGSFPTSDTAIVHLTASGHASLSRSNVLLQPNQYLHANRTAILTKLLGSTLVQSAVIRFAPGWRSSTGDDPRRITIILKPGR